MHLICQTISHYRIVEKLGGGGMCFSASEQPGGITLAAFLRFADAMMLDVAGVAERRTRTGFGLQNLLFQNGLRYSEHFSDFGNIKPCLFSVMQEMMETEIKE